MFTPTAYHTFETSLSNANAVLWLESLYNDLRSHLGKLLVLCVAVFGFPFVFFYGYSLQTKRRKFQKHMKKDFPLFKSGAEYLRFKESLEKLEVLMPSLMKVSGYHVQKAPWSVNYTLAQMQKMTSTLVTYNNWLKSRLNSLNEEQFKSSAATFKLVPEKELWQNRNQAYQYWM